MKSEGEKGESSASIVFLSSSYRIVGANGKDEDTPMIESSTLRQSLITSEIKGRERRRGERWRREGELELNISSVPRSHDRDKGGGTYV